MEVYYEPQVKAYSVSILNLFLALPPLDSSYSACVRKRVGENIHEFHFALLPLVYSALQSQGLTNVGL